MLDASTTYEVLIGTPTFMNKNGIHVEADVEIVMNSYEVKGRTAVLIAVNGNITHYLLFSTNGCPNLIRRFMIHYYFTNER